MRRRTFLKSLVGAVGAVIGIKAIPEAKPVEQELFRDAWAEPYSVYSPGGTGYHEVVIENPGPPIFSFQFNNMTLRVPTNTPIVLPDTHITAIAHSDPMGNPYLGIVTLRMATMEDWQAQSCFMRTRPPHLCTDRW